MPHDANGTPLKVGDKVIIEGTITRLEGEGDSHLAYVGVVNPKSDNPDDAGWSFTIPSDLVVSDEDTDDEAQPPNPDDPKAENGSCAPEPKGRDWPSVIANILIGLVGVLGIWFWYNAYKTQPKPESPVEFAAQFVEAEIDSWQRILDARRQALKWATAQGLIADAVNCDRYECSVVTHEMTWGLRGCHRGECEIGSRSRPRPQFNWWIPNGDSSSKCLGVGPTSGELIEVPCPK